VILRLPSVDYRLGNNSGLSVKYGQAIDYRDQTDATTEFKRASFAKY
jgi:hypothetical protein